MMLHYPDVATFISFLLPPAMLFDFFIQQWERTPSAFCRLGGWLTWSVGPQPGSAPRQLRNTQSSAMQCGGRRKFKLDICKKKRERVWDTIKEVKNVCCSRWSCWRWLSESVCDPCGPAFQARMRPVCVGRLALMTDDARAGSNSHLAVPPSHHTVRHPGKINNWEWKSAEIDETHYSRCWLWLSVLTWLPKLACLSTVQRTLVSVALL